MIYVLATIQVKIGMLDEWLDIFWNRHMPLREKLFTTHKIESKLAAQWQTHIGTYCEMTNLWSYADLENMQRWWEVRGKGGEKYTEAVTALQLCTASENIKIMQATPRSALQ